MYNATPQTIGWTPEERAEKAWPIWFIQSRYMLSNEVVEVMRGEAGAEILASMYGTFGDKLYESPLYILREELYRILGQTGVDHPEFFDHVDKTGAVLLDYGCGTAEFDRARWIERGNICDLYDSSEEIRRYLRDKYPMDTVRVKSHGNELAGSYDAIVCTDVFEHVTNPKQLMQWLVYKLSAGGSMLVHFCQDREVAGHLEQAIDAYPEWLKWVNENMQLIGKRDDYLWLQRRTDARLEHGRDRSRGPRAAIPWIRPRQRQGSLKRLSGDNQDGGWIGASRNPSHG